MIKLRLVPVTFFSTMTDSVTLVTGPWLRVLWMESVCVCVWGGVDLVSNNIVMTACRKLPQVIFKAGYSVCMLYMM